jgi:hypothetical protein
MLLMVGTCCKTIPSLLADDLLGWDVLVGCPVLLAFFSSNTSSEIVACALPRAAEGLSLLDN